MGVTKDPLIQIPGSSPGVCVYWQWSEVIYTCIIMNNSLYETLHSYKHLNNFIIHYYHKFLWVNVNTTFVGLMCHINCAKVNCLFITGNPNLRTCIILIVRIFLPFFLWENLYFSWITCNYSHILLFFIPCVGVNVQLIFLCEGQL